jgi:hypothetical protein
LIAPVLARLTYLKLITYWLTDHGYF